MKPNRAVWLFVADVFALAVVTVIGFASHAELGSAGLRMLSTFVPLTAAWAVSAAALGLYPAGDRAEGGRAWWLPLLAGLLAGPLAAALRGLWLNRPILPVFVVVLTAITMAGMLGWRGLIAWVLRRGVPHG